MASDTWQVEVTHGSADCKTDSTDYNATTPIATKSGINQRISGHCWDAVNIPQGSTINSASIQVYAIATGLQAYFSMTAYDVDDADITFDSGDTPQDRYDAGVTGGVDWMEQFVGAGWQTSPDISSLIQALVNRAAFAEDGVCILFDPYAAVPPKWTGLLHVYYGNAEEEPNYGAKLNADWTPPSAGADIVNTGHHVLDGEVAYGG